MKEDFLHLISPYLDAFYSLEEEIITTNVEVIEDIVGADTEPNIEAGETAEEVLNEFHDNLTRISVPVKALLKALVYEDFAVESAEREVLINTLQVVFLKRTALEALAKGIEYYEESEQASKESFKLVLAILGGEKDKEGVRESVKKNVSKFPWDALSVEIGEESLQEDIITNIDSKDSGKSVLMTRVTQADEKLQALK